MISYIIKINGVYDILCAISMLNIVYIPVLDNLHVIMFNKNEDPITKRMFAYWIFTYGIIRLHDNVKMVMMSYLIESACLLNELHNKRMKKNKVYFCILGCFAMVVYGINIESI